MVGYLSQSALSPWQRGLYNCHILNICAGIWAHVIPNLCFGLPLSQWTPAKAKNTGKTNYY